MIAQYLPSPLQAWSVSASGGKTLILIKLETPVISNLIFWQ